MGYGFYDPTQNVEVKVSYRLSESHPFNALKASLLKNPAFYDKHFMLSSESIYEMIKWIRFVLYDMDLIHL